MTVTLGKVIKEFLGYCQKFRAPRTEQTYRAILERFLAFAGDKDIAAMTPNDLLLWGKTWHEIQAVQRAFSWATNEAELIPRNLFRKIQRPPLGHRRRIVDRGLLAKMLKGSRKEFRLFLVALKETLARPGEVRTLDWDHVVWEQKPLGMAEALRGGRAVFVLEEYKARSRRSDPSSPRVIPITPYLGRLLVQISKRRGQAQGKIFLNGKGKPWTNNAVRCRIRHLRNKLGLKPDQRGENIVAYTLRHTLATWASARGVRDRTLADLMGHTSTRTTARYQHLQVEHLVEALKAIHRKKRPEGKGQAPVKEGQGPGQVLQG